MCQHKCHCTSGTNNTDCCSVHHSQNDNSDSRHAGHSFTGKWLWPGVSFILLLAGLIMEHTGVPILFHNRWISTGWYFLAFLPVGLSVMKEAVEGLLEKDFFNEYTLMTIASIGAFFINECPEGVAVMLFYCVGETLQDKAVDRVKKNINQLLSLKTEKVTLIEGNGKREASPEEVNPGAELFVKPGERVALDCILESEATIFDTSALTGESLPKMIDKGESVLAGMIPISVAVTLRVEREYRDSTLSKIIKMVSEAADKKSHYVKFISRFAKVYTPTVMLLAIALVAIPALISILNPDYPYDFSMWFSRALVFLVISCPCALVISVPLGYFVGIGAASRLGILVKGGNYLDVVRSVDTIAFDKTGTLTTGRLTVKDVTPYSLSKEKFLSILASVEEGSNHPLAVTIVTFAKDHQLQLQDVNNIKEIPGYGLIGDIEGNHVVVGNLKLLRKQEIKYPSELDSIEDTLIACAVNGEFIGFVTFSDEIKSEAPQSLKDLKSLGIKQIIMLSGDNQNKVDAVSGPLGIDKAYGELTPAGKAEFVKKISEDPKRKIAYVGDGINDAPVLALSNVGIAMGGLGADIAVENSDVVIQTDKLTKIPELIKIGRITHRIIMENIVFAIGIKVIVLLLASLGYFNLWAAVFADVGVSLLAILNSMRIFWKVKY